MINQLLSRAFIVSNRKFTVSFQKTSVAKCGSFYLTAFNAPINEKETKESCRMCFDTMEVGDSSTQGEYGFTLSGDTLTVKNNQMNTRGIYYIFEPGKNIFVLFDSLLLAREILTACGLEVTYSSAKMYENGSHFRYVKQLECAEVLSVKASGDTLRINSYKERDILEETEIDSAYTQEKAQENFYEVLFRATGRLTDCHHEVSIPLSGGIDSGTIAYLLTQLKKKVTAYNIVTEWGSEYEDAKSTADYIGVSLHQMFISTDDIVKEIPNIIAAFGFTVASNIEISLVPQCLFRKVKEQKKDTPILFATGFGSDLLNAGIYKPFTRYEELRSDIISTLKKTRMPNETYSNLFYRNNSMYPSISVVHPFWDPAVIVESLRIPTEFKVKENRDKYFFRKMMEQRLGIHNSWRKKWAAHHGTGIGFNLRNALSKGDQISREEYEQYFKGIHEQIFYRNDFTSLH